MVVRCEVFVYPRAASDKSLDVSNLFILDHCLSLRYLYLKLPFWLSGWIKCFCLSQTFSQALLFAHYVGGL